MVGWQPVVVWLQPALLHTQPHCHSSHPVALHTVVTLIRVIQGGVGVTRTMSVGHLCSVTWPGSCQPATHLYSGLCVPCWALLIYKKRISSNSRRKPCVIFHQIL